MSHQIPSYARLCATCETNCVSCGEHPLRYSRSTPLGIETPQNMSFITLAAFPSRPPEYSYPVMKEAYSTYPSCSRLGTLMCQTPPVNAGVAPTAGWDAERNKYYLSPFMPSYELDPPAYKSEYGWF